MKTFLIISLTLLVISCTPKVRVLVQYPPPIDVPKNTTIELHTFQVSGNYKTSDLTKQLGRLFSTTSVDYNSYFQEQLQAELNQVEHIKIQQFNADLYADGSLVYTTETMLNTHKRTRKIKKMEKVEETVKRFGKDTVIVKDVEKTYKEKYNVYESVRTLNISGTIRFYKSNGDLLHAAKVSERIRRSSESESKKDALSKTPEPERMILDGISKCASSVKRQFFPISTYHTFNFKEGESEEVNDAITFARKNKWEEAFTIWQMFVNSAELSDKIASIYNLAIYYEYKLQFGAALEYYKRANSVSSSSIATMDIKRIKNRMKMQERL